MIENIVKYLKEEDFLIGCAISDEMNRQNRNIELIASENIVSKAVMLAMGSCLTNKYAEGYPGKRYYGGCEYIDVIERIAIERAKELFNAEHVNVQPHSGAQANYAVYQALCNVGDTVLGMDLSNGGHLTHGHSMNFSGKNYNMVFYGVDENGFIDYENVRKLAKEHKPKMIIAGASAYPRAIDFQKFAEIAHEVNAYLFVDMAHIAGLVAAGLHTSPVPYADVVTTTTHKTLRGPRGGMILCKEELAKKIDSSVFPGSQGGPLEHIIAAKAICLGEALEPEFKEYQKQVLLNAKTLSESLKAEGFNIVSGGTDNHLMLVDLRNFDITGKEMEKRLDEVYITVNKNSIPNDPAKPFVTSGIRIGTPAVTTRGFKEEEMKLIAKMIRMVVDKNWENNIDTVRKMVIELTEKYPLYK